MTLRLRDLSATFGLDPVDVDLLLVGIAADADPRFEAFFGYLNDDVSRRRPSVAVALELAGVPLASPAATRTCSTGRWSGSGWSSSTTWTGRSRGGRCGCRTGSPRTCSATTPPTPSSCR